MLCISGYWANLPVTWKIWLSKVIPHFGLFSFCIVFQQFWEIISYNWLIVDSYGNVHKSWVTNYYLMNFTSFSLWKVGKLFVVTTVLGINLNHWKACVFPLNDGTFVRKMHLRVDQESWVCVLHPWKLARSSLTMPNTVFCYWLLSWASGTPDGLLVSDYQHLWAWTVLQQYGICSKHTIWLIWIVHVL